MLKAAYYMGWVKPGQLVQRYPANPPRRVTKVETVEGYTTLYLGDGEQVRGKRNALIDVIVEDDRGPEALIDMMRL